jgi:tetraacyldisaccharide 4'-kinase
VPINRSYIEDVMYGRRSSPAVSALLQLLSIPYGLLVSLRKALIAAGLLRRKKLAERVISVGNLTVGGTGKTPAVMNIAEIMLKHQKRPVVISRGYGRRDESAITVVSDGNRLHANAWNGGDEPVLIGSKLAGVPVIAGSDRYRAGVYAHERFGNDTVILDDGFQHIRLSRDMDIVLVDAGHPFGNGKLMPAGILREPLSALKRADAVLITGIDRAMDLASVVKAVKSHTRAAIFTSYVVPVDLVDLASGERKPLSALQGSTVIAVAGIARPGSFVRLLQSLKAEVKAECFFPDHYNYGKNDLAEIFQCAADQKAGMIVTTEKDAVRLKPLNPEGIWALTIELHVVEKDEWEALLLKTE